MRDEKGFDWRTSSLHIDWLASFRKPKDIQVECESFSKKHSRLLKENIERTIRDFIDTELLVPLDVSPANHEQKNYLILSEKGRGLIEAFKEQRKQEEANAKQICFQSLLNGNLHLDTLVAKPEIN